MTTPNDDDEIASRAIARATQQAAQVYRDVWRDRRQVLVFWGGGLLSASIFNALVTAPILDVGWVVTTALVVGPLVVLIGLIARQYRCPRCERVPLAPAQLIAHRRSPLGISGCAACGLVFSGAKKDR